MTEPSPPAPSLQGARALHRGLLAFQLLPILGAGALFAQRALPLLGEAPGYAGPVAAGIDIAVLAFAWFWLRAAAEARRNDPALSPDPWTDRELQQRAFFYWLALDVANLIAFIATLFLGLGPIVIIWLIGLLLLAAARPAPRSEL